SPRDMPACLHDALPIFARSVGEVAKADQAVRHERLPRVRALQRFEPGIPDQLRALGLRVEPLSIVIRPILAQENRPGSAGSDALDRKSTRLNSSHEWTS